MSDPSLWGSTDGRPSADPRTQLDLPPVWGPPAVSGQEPAWGPPASSGQGQEPVWGPPAASGHEPPGGPSTTPAVYRTRSFVLRRRILTGLAGAVLLLIGYGIGRWQDSPAPAPVAVTKAAAGPSAAPSVAPPTSAPPTPTVYQTLQAESADALNGIQTQDTTDQGGGKNVGWIANGDSLRFDHVDFGPVAATKLDVRVASDGGQGRMEIHLDSPGQPAAGILSVSSTGGWQTWRTDVVGLTTPVTGTHTVYFTFVGSGGDEFVNINWLLFQH